MVSISTTVLGAVRYDGPDGGLRFAAALDHLARLYGPLLPDGQVSGTWDAASGSGVAVIGGPIGPGGAGWGRPLGPGGIAGPEELHGALSDPARARDLYGFWAMAGWTPEGLRLVTTAEPVHTLKRVEGDGATAWATRGLAAHALAGVRPVLDDERIPELVLFDMVLGDRELLAATRVEERATVIDIGREGWRSRSHWPLEERLAPGPVTTPADLRTALGGLAARIDAVPQAILGLTSGRDSTLLASCIAERGGRVDTFTMGDPAWPDVLGATAVAATLGWRHTVLAPPDPTEAPPPSFASAVRWSLWTEGLELGRDLVGPGLADVGGGERLLLTGLGGEAGRGLYWQGDGSMAPLDQLLVHRDLLPAPQRERLVARLEDALQRAAASGRAGRSLLDVVYIEERMRKWLMRSRPIPWVGGTVAAYLGTDVLRALIDLPEEDRATGRAFDAAIALGRPPLRPIALAAAPPPIRPPRWRRAVGRLRSAPPVTSPEAQVVLGLLDGLPGGPARTDAALGPGVLDRLRRAAPAEGGARHRLWTVLSIEALDAALAELPWPTAR
jgi:hypothetical protein